MSAGNPGSLASPTITISPGTPVAYSKAESDALLQSVRDDYDKRFKNVDADRIRNVKDLVDKVEQTAAELRLLIHKEIKAVILSLSEMTPPETEDLFGSTISLIVKNALATVSAEHSKQIEVIESRLRALEARPS